MKLQFASDLHLEFDENKKFLTEKTLVPLGDLLILAGDIVPFSEIHNHSDFFDYISANFKTTYWIAGNHEYYHSDIAEYEEEYCKVIRSNIFLVNNKAIINNGVKFIFSTLWSHINPVNKYAVERALNDFYLIRNGRDKFTATDFNKKHNHALKFIKRELKDSKEFKCVVVSHHVPTLENYPPKYRRDAINDAFAVELGNLIDKYKPCLWIYGHHHFGTPDFKIGRTIMATNQLGYVRLGEHHLFNTAKIIEL